MEELTRQAGCQVRMSTQVQLFGGRNSCPSYTCEAVNYSPWRHCCQLYSDRLGYSAGVRVAVGIAILYVQDVLFIVKIFKVGPW